MVRRAHLVPVLAALTILLAIPLVPVAGAEQGPNRVIANMTIGTQDGAGVLGTVKADIHAPTSWADPPGYYEFKGTGDIKAGRGVIERVFFWPWYDEANGQWANWAWAWSHQCVYFADREPTCEDASFAFIDYVNPSFTDYQVTCWWDGGVRPAGGTWDLCDLPTAHQEWLPVVSGSLVVLMSK